MARRKTKPEARKNAGAKLSGADAVAERTPAAARAKAALKASDAASVKAKASPAGARSKKARHGKGGTAETGRGQKKRGGRPRRSQADADAKRQRILGAALQVFSQHGFEAARLDEVARKAGVAKGTLYLYYPNKQAMFEALVRTSVDPLLDDLSAVARQQALPPEEVLENIFELFRRDVLETDRKLIIRLIIAEGSRFPEIAQFYHREVITRVLTTLRAITRALNDQDRLASDALLRYPQLIAAPLLLSVVWDALFARIDPLDVKGLLSAHAELITTVRRRKRR